MDATSTSSTVVNSRWAKINLLLEPQLIDNSGNDASRFLDISADGEPTYEPKEDATAKLSKGLRKLWAERGDYAKITVAALQEEDEKERLATEKTDATPAANVDGAKEQDSTTETEEEGMSRENLMKMKQEILGKLEDARMTMLNSHTLLTLLLSNVSSNVPRPPQNPAVAQRPLPPIEGLPSMATTLTTPAPPSVSTLSRSLKVSIGTKNTSVRRAAGIFSKAAEEVDQGLKAGTHYWTQASALREGWRLGPKGKVGGIRRRPVAQRETAKDFAIYFGLEGSSLQQRLASSAYLSPHPTHPTLVFPARTHRRLRITLRSLRPCLLDHLTGSSKISFVGDDASLDGHLQEAQREGLDQEMFDRVTKEISDLHRLYPVIREYVVSLRPINELELSFELVNTSSFPAPSLPETPVITLLSHMLPIFYLPRSRPSLLRPVLQGLRYLEFCGAINQRLERLREGLKASGVNVDIDATYVGEDGEKLLKGLLREDDWGIGGEVKLTLEGCAPIFVRVTYPSILVLQTLRESINITSMDDLGQYMGKEILHRLTAQLERLGRRILRTLPEPGDVEWVTTTGKGWGKWQNGAVAYELSMDESTYSISASAIFTRTIPVREKGRSRTKSAATQQQQVKEIFDAQKSTLGQWFQDTLRSFTSKPDGELSR